MSWMELSVVIRLPNIGNLLNFFCWKPFLTKVKHVERFLKRESRDKRKRVLLQPSNNFHSSSKCSQIPCRTGNTKKTRQNCFPFFMTWRWDQQVCNPGAYLEKGHRRRQKKQWKSITSSMMHELFLFLHKDIQKHSNIMRGMEKNPFSLTLPKNDSKWNSRYFFILHIKCIRPIVCFHKVITTNTLSSSDAII